MMRTATTFISLLLIATPLFAQDFNSTKKEFKRAVLAMDQTGVRSSADILVSLDSRKAVDVLLDGYGMCAKKLKILQKEKNQNSREMEPYRRFMQAYRDARTDRTKRPPPISDSDRAKLRKYTEYQKRGQGIEKEVMNVEAVKREIVRHLSRFFYTMSKY